MFAKATGIALCAAGMLGCVAARPISAPGVPWVETDPLSWKATCEDWDEWDKPGPPYQIYGGVYYVGTCGITSLLLVSDSGHVLIDSGTDAGAQIVIANIKKLGFDPRDVRYLLTSHEHFDHVGGIARLQAATGATVLANAPTSTVLRSGKPSEDDPQVLSQHPSFPPVTGKIRLLSDQEVLSIGGREIHSLPTPGHSPGALSWSWLEKDRDTGRLMVYADSLSPISSDSYKFSDHPEYLESYRKGIETIRSFGRCLLMTPHPSASKMPERIEATGLQRGTSLACAEYANAIEARLDKRLADEAAQ